jgi:hypothetical protein
MKNKKYGNTMALKEHLLKGHKVSRLESLLFFGVNQLDTVIKELKRDGFILKKAKVPMAKIINRINKSTTCKPPKILPTLEIIMTEWWVSR